MVKETFDKLSLSTMTWREIFDTIEGNFVKVYNMLLSRSIECYVEQFPGGSSEYLFEHTVNTDTTLLIFRSDKYIGGKEGSSDYVVSENGITFVSALEEDETLTVQFLHADALANVSAEYVKQIKEMYDSLSSLNINIIGLQEENVSIQDYINEIGGQIVDAAAKATAAMEYIKTLTVGEYDDPTKLSSEITSARRGLSLLGERLDIMPFKFNTKAELLSSTLLKDGDIAMVQDGDYLRLYRINDSYSGSLPKEVLVNKKVAVQLFTNYTENEVENTYKLIGTEARPVTLSDLSYGHFWVNGFYRTHPKESSLRTHQFLPARVYYEESSLYKIFKITVGTTNTIVKYNKSTDEYDKVEVPSIGNYDISSMSDGSLTGAIVYLMDRINTLEREKAAIEDIAHLSVSAPLVVDSVSKMTNESRNYVLSTTGELYSWVAGNPQPTGLIYNSSNVIKGVSEIYLTEEGKVRLVLNDEE